MKRVSKPHPASKGVPRESVPTSAWTKPAAEEGHAVIRLDVGDKLGHLEPWRAQLGFVESVTDNRTCQQQGIELARGRA
jgi:hypothetical protein